MVLITSDDNATVCGLYTTKDKAIDTLNNFWHSHPNCQKHYTLKDFINLFDIYEIPIDKFDIYGII